MPADLISVIYVSSAPHRMGAEELDDILRVSRANNQRDAISSLLLYADGNFIQGPEQAIEALLARLAHDHRHRDVTVIGRIPIGDRHFPDWSMGFCRFDGNEGREVSEAFFDLKNPLANLNEKRSLSLAHRLLERFRQTNIE